MQPFRSATFWLSCVALAATACSASPSKSGDAIDASACASSAPVTLAASTLALAPFELLAGNAISAPHVAGGYVYWVQFSDGPTDAWNSDLPEHIATIERVATSGGATETLVTFGIRSDRITEPQIAFDAEYMYWVEDTLGGDPSASESAVMRSRLDGSGVTAVLGGLSHPSGLAIANGKIFFNLGASVHRTNLDGTSLETIDASEPQSFASGTFAVSSDYLYQVDGKGLKRVSTAGGRFMPFVAAPESASASGLGGVTQTATDGFAIVSSFDATHPFAPADIVRWSIAGGGTVTIASDFIAGPTWTSRTAVDSDEVYFNGANAILRVATAGGPIEFVGPTGRTGGIAFDETHVYWTSWFGDTATVSAACK